MREGTCSPEKKDVISCLATFEYSWWYSQISWLKFSKALFFFTYIYYNTRQCKWCFRLYVMIHEYKSAPAKKKNYSFDRYLSFIPNIFYGILFIQQLNKLHAGIQIRLSAAYPKGLWLNNLLTPWANYHKTIVMNNWKHGPTVSYWRNDGRLFIIIIIAFNFTNMTENVRSNTSVKPQFLTHLKELLSSHASDKVNH